MQFLECSHPPDFYRILRSRFRRLSLLTKMLSGIPWKWDPLPVICNWYEFH